VKQYHLDHLLGTVGEADLAQFEATVVWRFISRHLRFLAEFVVQAYTKDVLASVGVQRIGRA
jgi:hypothetical protein